MYLGFDCGTSGLKALLTDENGAAVASASRPYSPERPKPGWSEQDPDVWRAAMAGAISDLRQTAPGLLAAVKAVGFSGQMHGVVLIGADGRPVMPAILHNDSRAHEEAAELAAERPELARIVGVKPMASFPGPKMLWLSRRKALKGMGHLTLLAPKDYLRLALCGERRTDMSDAAGTWLLDEAARKWSEEAADACQVDPAWLPPLAEGLDAVGEISAGDAAAGGVGLGAIAPGEAFISLGTAAQLVVAGDRYLSAPDLLVHGFAHALPGRWLAMAAMLNGAGALAFAARLLGAAPDTLERDAAQGYEGPGPLLFLPYLSGERTPLDDPNARGVLFGMSETTSRTDVARAVMEGVAMTLAEARDCLASADVHLDRAGLIGGGARSQFWTRIVAAATGLRILRMAGGETGPALGAARLARLAATAESPEAVCTSPKILDVTEPDPSLAAALAGQRIRFKALRTAVKSEFHR